VPCMPACSTPPPSPCWPACRAAVFLRAADLLSTEFRNRALATTMIGQGKTAYQAEIDAVAEAADFFRFGVQCVCCACMLADGV